MGHCRLCGSFCKDGYLVSQNGLCLPCTKRYPKAADEGQSHFIVRRRID
jgi:hypothetical protein